MDKRRELVAFGKALKRIRKNNKYTQDELSLYSRVDRSFISELENGEKSASFLTIVSLTKALHIPISEFMVAYEREIHELEDYNFFN
ncbi:helix-turn-helix domain-containing protein [Paenibacillus odorifer]|uniref:helix-turn-helix domain-containing protein n=1 Tax=Paenibacillus odorifer TaxID=189426 RepID=UPI00096EBD1B|nr:helix-turn-helix transcriptional regulator [Paenibacillus odorifer]OME27750.1 transcriptional regulator [Paenibacillus odorifer]